MLSLSWIRSSLGKKMLMAASGLALSGFILMHLAGNLLIYRGPGALNAYAAKLEHLGPWLWAARAGLLAALVIHLVTSVQLTLENRRARPQAYAAYHPVETTLAARTMMATGVLLLAYLVYHLLHFSFRVTNPEISHGVDALGRRDVYTMVVRSFQQLPIAVAYVLGVAAVCMHLSHGIASTCQTLGLNNERTLAAVSLGGRALAAALFLGYSAIPVAVFTGVIR
jgi:succinate dehydrogenase / fumarate reductase cytochrome b subunit